MSVNTDIEWQRKLVEMYRDNRLLWDSNFPDFYNLPKKEKVWSEISQELNAPVDDLKRKIKSMLSSYRRERKRVNERKNYKSKWYGFSWFQFYEQFYTVKYEQNQEYTIALPPDNAEGPAVNPHKTHNSSENPSPSEKFSNKNINVDSTSPVSQLRLLSSTSQDECSSGTNGDSCSPPPRKKMCPECLMGSSGVDEDVLLEMLLKRKTPDQYDAFGSYLSSELRKYDSKVLTRVKRAIVDILFKADVGGFNKEMMES